MKNILFVLCCTLSLTACAFQPNVTAYSQASALTVPPDNVTAALTLPSNSTVDFIVVQKKQRLLTLWNQGQLVKTYPIIATGASPVGKKVYEGDERTPEGQYYINEKHVSQRFQKFLEISYPNETDKANAKKMRLSAGGHVGLHGDMGGVAGFFQRFDKKWTDGCLAMRNADIEDIYARVAVGTPILIKP